MTAGPAGGDAGELMPAAFIGHGNPMNALETNRYTQAWAQRFDEDAKARMLDDPVAVTRLDGHRDFRRAVPTPDHFLPLLYLAGLADTSGQGADVLVDGYTYGSLSMTSYTIGMECPPSGDVGANAAQPAPAAPPDASNI